MPTTYGTAFAAHHARGSTFRPLDTTFRPDDTIIHRLTMLRPRATFRSGDTTVRHQPTTTTTKSTRLGAIASAPAIVLCMPVFGALLIHRDAPKVARGTSRLCASLS